MASDPGRVQVLGVDMYNTSPSMVNTFRASTEATFPILLNGTSTTGTNMQPPYGDRDNYVIISPQRTIRYNAQLKYAHGNRFHLTEMQAVIDSLLDESVVGVPTPGTMRRFALEAVPSPFHTSLGIRLVNSADVARHARVEVFDLGGRRVAELWDGPAPAGISRIEWRPTSDLAGGVYLVRARIGAEELVRRVVRVR